MKSSQSLSKPAAAAKPRSSQGFRRGRRGYVYCPPVKVANANLIFCGHSATCKGCTEELMNLKEPCPLCRKPISGFTVGKWQSTIGDHGLWPTSLKNLTQLASGEGFNEYFRKQFNGNEEAYLRWKEVFDVLEIGSVRDVGPDLPLERQVLVITKSEDLVKLGSLAKLRSKEFFNDATLLVVAWSRILEVLVLAMPPVVDEKKARGKKKKQQRKNNDPKKLDILDACAALRVACNEVGGFEDSRRYFKRGKEGYEEQLGPDDAKTLEVTCCLILATRMSKGELIEKLRDLWKRCERALGEENVVTLQTLNALGNKLYRDGKYEAAKEVWERCLAGRTKVLGEDHLETLMTLNNLGLLYNEGLKNNEKALEYYERVLKGKGTRGRWGRIVLLR